MPRSAKLLVIILYTIITIFGFMNVLTVFMPDSRAFMSAFLLTLSTLLMFIMLGGMLEELSGNKESKKRF